MWEVTYGDGKVINTSQLSDLTKVSKRSTHDDGLVSELLIVIEDGLDGLDSGIFLLGVCLSGASLVPIEDSANEGRDEEDAGFSSSDGLY